MYIRICFFSESKQKEDEESNGKEVGLFALVSACVTFYLLTECN